MKRFPWMTLALVVLCSVADGTAFEYERSREVWRLLTGQMVHWTPRMALFDLGMLLGLGAWLEIRGDRRLAAVALGLGAVLTAVAVHLSPNLSVYRGSSGMASALFVLAAFRIADSPGDSLDPWTRTLAVAAVALFLAKAAFESLAGQTLFAGELPEGVRVVPLVHLLGGLAGAAHLVSGGLPGRGATARSRAGSAGRPR
jgi:membrane associated rhomboid family serine protease